MPFYVFAWVAEFFYGLGAIAGKLSSKHQIANPWLFNFVWILLVTILTLPFAFVAGIQWPVHWGPLWLLALFSATSATLYILALYALDVSILGPLYTLRIAISGLLGVIWFDERLSSYQIGLMVLMIMAGLFVSIDESMSIRSFFRKSVVLGLVSVVNSAIYNATVRYAMQFEGYWEVTVWGQVLGQVLLLVTIPFFWKDIRNVRLNQWSGLIGSTVLVTLGFLAANRALAENLSVSSAIMSIPLSMVMVVLFSVFAPKLLEHHTLKVYTIRFSAVGVMVWAALQLQR